MVIERNFVHTQNTKKTYHSKYTALTGCVMNILLVNILVNGRDKKKPMSCDNPIVQILF